MAEKSLLEFAPVVTEAARAFATDPSYLVDLAKQGAMTRARREGKVRPAAA